MILLLAALASILPLSRAALAADDAPTPPAGPAAWLRERVDVDGSVRAGAWTSSRDLDDGGARGVAWLWLEGRARLVGPSTLRVAGYVGHERIFYGGGSLSGFLREAYLEIPLGRLELRLGRQIIVWGRADGLNPTDSLNARNFTRLFTDDDDQRQGLADARVTLRAGATSVTGVWLARASSDTVPASPPPRFVVETEPPEQRQPQFALKLERTGTFDWSLSYYDGVHPFPDLGFTPQPPPIPLVWRNHRARVMGADVATVAGRFGLHAEAAYQLTDDPDGVDPFVRNPFVYVVAGADRAFGASLSANLQYVFRQVLNYSDPRQIADPLTRGVAVPSAVVAQQLERTRNGATLRLAQKLRHETVTAEVFGAAFTDGDYVVRPKLSVALTDRVKAIAGGDVFRGPATTFLGRLRTNTAFFSELRYAF